MELAFCCNVHFTRASRDQGIRNNSSSDRCPCEMSTLCMFKPCNCVWKNSSWHQSCPKKTAISSLAKLKYPELLNTILSASRRLPKKARDWNTPRNECYDLPVLFPAVLVPCVALRQRSAHRVGTRLQHRRFYGYLTRDANVVSSLAESSAGYFHIF